MIDPFNRLYRLQETLLANQFDLGGAVSGSVVSMILITFSAIVSGMIVGLFPALDMLAVFVCCCGASGTAYFFYQFIRMFFNATTANSEAEVNADSEKYG